MNEAEMIHNALGVNRKAEGELIGIALRYELYSGLRLNWMVDTVQCISVLNSIIECDNAELKNRASGFYEALNDAEMERLAAQGLIFPSKLNNGASSITKKQRIYRGQKVT